MFWKESVCETKNNMDGSWCKSPAHVGPVASSPYKGLPPPSPALTRRALRAERVLTQAPLQPQRSETAQESAQSKARGGVIDREALLVQNAEIIASNTKLLSTIALYEKRYSDLLADRERTYQALAVLQRKNSQLQGERDALAVQLPALLKQFVATLSAANASEHPPEGSTSSSTEPSAAAVASTDATVQTTPVLVPGEVPEPPRKTHQKRRKAPPTPKQRTKKTGRSSKASSSSSSSARAPPTDVCCMRL